MQLTYPKAPANGAQVLRPALQAALQSKGFGVNRQIAQATASKVSLSEPYRGYSLSLEDLAQGKGLQQAALGDWHYLVFSDGGSIADAQLAEVAGQVEFSSLNHGAMASATVNALNLAEKAPHLKGRTFELRVLFVSALQVVAIWLHASDEDVLIPIEPTPKRLASTKLYSEAALLALLAPAAQQAKAAFDADTTGLLGG
ncbi:hypothetical protein C4K38_5199 [Pseudomonas chlororaphis subsp. piscium]|uniref:hypothetical protein n=1 Tax=Pseudomonas chlororaphis TaxID=587753 RepID=UPI0006A5FB0D|nr:hypothetical protein [Pseudomonas chlororaphis]AZC33136.1 hypothetical protein C4K38_5199 [Pseudomonas chlororaphis subsp. piscium]WDG90814.1 hypothetical protein PUP49_26625 [Pseudomonas chlororaphis]SDS40863.1 hypothetical protein SAMN05216585_2193 [Pseudomonas chlororaphis]